MSQDEAELPTLFADHLLNNTDSEGDNALEVVIELAGTVSASQELSGSEVGVFGQ